jgi:hypothetical protein
VSRYEWEAGTIIIPAKEWPDFKRTLRESHNRLQALRFELATSLSSELKLLGRGKRNFDFEQAAEDLFHKRAQGRFSPISQDSFDVLRAIFKYPEGSEPAKKLKPLVPKKKDFPQATSKTNSFDCGEASISIEDKGRRFSWSVPENNHACERAHEHPMAVAAFRSLDRIKWARNSGGKITGNDEYNQESKNEGSGSNYVVRGYGPLGEDPFLKRFRKRR